MLPSSVTSFFHRISALFRTFRSQGTSHTYCTYFDIRYLDKGLCLYDSIREHIRDAELWVLCLDPEVQTKLQDLNLPGIHTIAMDELERFDPALKACRANRRLVEYYFTATPCLVKYLLKQTPNSGWVTYLDSDLFFFGSPCPILKEMNAGDVAIIPHRFSEKQRNLEIYGKYNVGWVSLRKTRGGIRCANWWRERCLEWCKDVPEDGKFADQKYLDDFHKITRRVVVLNHPGANFAPWNLPNHTITKDLDRIEIDGQELIFFHFHDCKPAGERTFDPGFDKFGHTLPEVIRDYVYLPYLRLLMEKRRIGGSSTMRFDDINVPLPAGISKNLITVPPS